jgi:hypothetical protein
MFSVLMTVFNEGDFIEYAIQSCLPYVDHLVIVEGSYQETIALGANPRSTDGTIETIHNLFSIGETSSEFSLNMPDGKTIEYVQANEKSDPQQRNIGLERIKKLNPDGWMLIVDGDEVWDQNNINMAKVISNIMDKQGRLACYVKSLTFVNDFWHYTEQYFPRIFKITPGIVFTSDNYTEWTDKGLGWFIPHIIKVPYIQYHHYGFCKGLKKFEQKLQWWSTRFGRDFDYGWHLDENGKITDDNHNIYEYSGNHPAIMQTHPMYKEKIICPNGT